MSHHHCEECGAKIVYRLMKGTSIEGVSIREVYYNDKNKIVGWSDEPDSPVEASAEEISDWLRFMA